VSPKKILLASSIALALTASQVGNTSIEIQAEQNWLKKQLPVDKSGKHTVAYYVKYMPNSRTNLVAQLQASGAKINHYLDDYNTLSISLPADQVASLQSMSSIEFMEPVPVHKPMAQVVPWNIDQFQSRDVWDVDRDGIVDDGAPDGSGVKFCIIDTGFYAVHDDFQGITHTGESQIPGEAYTEDGNGHGTHVAGTANAMNNDIGVVGVMPGGADLHIIKIFNNAGVWSPGNSDLAAAAIACKDAGANAISMSLGGPSSVTEEAVFQDLYDNFNIINVAAAGNDGNNTASYPASYDSVISVAALREDESVASFSQFPPTSNDPNNPPANVEWDVVELSGGGENVLSTWPTPDGNIPVNRVTNDGVEYSGVQIAETGTGDVTQNLVTGGLCDSGDIDPSWSGNVVLCERGAIAFADKMNNVASNGGLAAIIYNNEAGALNGTCGGNCTSGATIPGIGITQADGQFLQSNGLGLPTNVLVDDGSGCVDCSGGYNTISGTSMATPGVAAGIAWAWSACGGPAGITNKELRQLLRDSAKDLTATPGYDVNTGFGLVQLKDALELGNERFGSTCPIGLSSSPGQIEVCTLPPAATADFTVTLDDAFAGTSNMSSSGTPVGSNSAFSVNPVISPANSTVFTVSNLDGLASASSMINLVATDASDPLNEASTNVTLVTVDAIPGSYGLTAPVDGATDVASQPTFTWATSSQADSYTFEIATDNGFVNVVESASGLSSPEYTLTAGLNNETEYFWRVTATNVCGDQDSATRSFTTGLEVCQIFTSTDVPKAIAISPAPGAVTSNLDINLNGTVSDINVVDFSGTHTWVNDLVFSLESPAATAATLMANVCGSEDNWDINFDDQAASATLPCPPNDGNSYIPASPLSVFNGESINGTWIMTVDDSVDADGGSFNSWGLEICFTPTGVQIGASDDDHAMNEDSGIQSLDVMSNDLSMGNATISTVTQGTNGTVTIDAGATTLSYESAADFCGADSFTYTLDDTSTATVNMTIACVNDQPQFTADASITLNLTAAMNPPANVVACEFDMGPDDEDISQSVNDFVVTVVSDPDGVLTSVDVDNNGSINAVYAGNLGTAVIAIAIQDDGGTSNDGVDTSDTQEIEIIVEDLIFKQGFDAEVVIVESCPNVG
jgi:subtilisin family serine protease